MTKLVHRGYKDHQLKDTSRRKEIIFAKGWRELNRLDPDFLSRLLGRPATQDDAIIAATVVQWLGEKKGIQFLEDNLKKCQGMVSVN